MRDKAADLAWQLKKVQQQMRAMPEKAGVLSDQWELKVATAEQECEEVRASLATAKSSGSVHNDVWDGSANTRGKHPLAIKGAGAPTSQHIRRYRTPPNGRDCHQGGPTARHRRIPRTHRNAIMLHQIIVCMPSSPIKTGDGLLDGCDPFGCASQAARLPRLDPVAPISSVTGSSGRGYEECV